MVRKKKEEVTTAPELEEAVEVVEQVEEQAPTGVAQVTVHLDRRDSGTNFLEAEALPSLND